MSVESDALVDKAIQALIQQATLAIVQGSTKALSQVGKNALEPLTSMESMKVGNERRLEQLFKRLGHNAQESVLESYADLITSRENSASRSHYRAGEGRLAGGIMRAALAREDFYSADSSGLEFINQQALDGAAAQWKRLAFGAGARGSGSDQGVSITLGDSQGVLALDQPASPGFSMPRGVFIGQNGIVQADSGRRGMDQFGPRTHSLVFATQGIRGRDFLTAGLRRIGSELPLAVQTMLDDIVADWAAKSTGSKTTTVTHKFVMPKV